MAILWAVCKMLIIILCVLGVLCLSDFIVGVVFRAFPGLEEWCDNLPLNRR